MKSASSRIVVLAVVAAGFIALAIGIAAAALLQPIVEASVTQDGNGFRKLDETFAIHRQLGWTVISSPNDERRYRICGAIGDNDPASEMSRMQGSFSTGGKSVSFDIPRPQGVEVSVEGLAPLDGGDLRYAVLTRPWKTDQTADSQ